MAITQLFQKGTEGYNHAASDQKLIQSGSYFKQVV